MADLPIWKAEYLDPGAQALWLAYYDELRWETRFTFLEILRKYAALRIAEFEEELVRYGWMIREGSNLRSVVPGRN